MSNAKTKINPAVELVTDKLLLGQKLNRPEALATFNFLFSGLASDALIKKILVLIAKKGLEPEELLAAVHVCMKFAKKINLPQNNLVDGCGTGGDQSHTFNISTIACLVAAGAGAVVAKHGNRSITSKCGSSDLMEALGVNILAKTEVMKRAIKQTGFGYFHAPLYHPAFSRIQNARKELSKKQIKTLFNLMGPLVNPARSKQQAIGIYNKLYLPLMAEVLKQINCRRALIFCHETGLDELAPYGYSRAIEINKGKTYQQRIHSNQFHFKKSNAGQLRGGTPKRNRKITLNILSGKDKGAKTDAVLMNAAAILYVSGKAKSLSEGIELARKSIASGNALRVLNQLKAITHGT